MEDAILIKGNTEQEVWQQIKQQLTAEPGFLNYKAQIEQGGRHLALLIDIDLGGGFQSGISTTTLSARLSDDPGFLFAIHRERLIDNVGKFFGMQDIVIGFPEFDDKMIIKTNDEKRTKKLFGLSPTRKLFNSLSNFSLHIESEHEHRSGREIYYLVFTIDEGITKLPLLRSIYKAFNDVLRRVDPM